MKRFLCFGLLLQTILYAEESLNDLITRDINNSEYFQKAEEKNNTEINKVFHDLENNETMRRKIDQLFLDHNFTKKKKYIFDDLTAEEQRMFDGAGFLLQFLK